MAIYYPPLEDDYIIDPLPKVIAVVGSRGIKNLPEFEKYLPADHFVVVTGGAAGIDQAIMSYCDLKDIKCKVIEPDYENHGASAPHIRNRKIVDIADEVYVFWDGKSPGSRSVMEYAFKQKKNVHVIQDW